MKLARVGAAVVLAIVIGAAGGVAAQEKKGTKDWDGDITGSFAAQTGSVNTLNASLDAKTERNWEKDRLQIRLQGSYGRVRDRGDTPSEDSTAENAQSLSFNHRRSLGVRTFWVSINETSRDTTQDREVRFWLATGPGYRFWEGEEVKKQYFDAAIKAGYRYELFDGNTGAFKDDGSADENGYDSNYADAIFSFDYRNLLFDGAMEWRHVGSFALPMNNTSAWLARTEGTMSIPLTEAWDFRAGILVEYNNNAPDDQNELLTRSNLGLAYKF